MTRYFALIAALFLLTGCSRQPQTDQDLQGEAENAIDRKLDTQGIFTLMEAFASQQIACGHVFAPDAPHLGKVDRDFVYVHKRLIMDDDADFDEAAAECDVAASGRNAAVDLSR